MANSIPDACSSHFVEEESDGIELLSGEEGMKGDNTNIGFGDSVIFFAPKKVKLKFGYSTLTYI